MGVTSYAAAAKRRLSRLINRAPWLATVAIGLLRRTRARFTVGVVGAVMNERGEVLIVEHVFHPQRSWGLPGGWVERGESPDEALRRELSEETGLEVSIQRPLLVSSGDYRRHVDVAFLCSTRHHVRHLSPELVAYRWVTPEELPPLPPFHQAAVRAAFAEGEREGELP